MNVNLKLECGTNSMFFKLADACIEKNLIRLVLGK